MLTIPRIPSPFSLRSNASRHARQPHNSGIFDDIRILSSLPSLPFVNSFSQSKILASALILAYQYHRAFNGFMSFRWLRLLVMLLGVLATNAAVPSTNHWAFQPISQRTPPAIKNHNWCRTSIDQFILAKLEECEIRPATPAEPHTLIRRIFFDLVGLPPAPAEVDRFIQDFQRNTATAVTDLTARLLNSPQYGERWGRWWLDTARYADTNGQDENKVMANAWRYRDWVIRSFNANLPFDLFITEQLAGDLLPPTDGEQENLDRLIATGFLVLGPKMLAEQDKPKLVMDIVDEQIDTVGRTFLGLTLGCARCHDHKFDPVPARDYYAMAGIFKSTRTMADLAFVSKFNETQIATRDQLVALAAHEKRLTEQNHRIKKLVREANDTLLQSDFLDLPNNPQLLYPDKTREALAALEKERNTLTNSAPSKPFALAVMDDKPVDLPIHLRGSHLNLGNESVPRGFIQVVARQNADIPRDHSGRLELARWLTSPDNPLTARVIVNRIWQGHFGEGLVRTPENFGLRGSPPTHPELLDWLAREFIRSGWDVKALHRLIIQSSVYQQSAQGASGSETFADPENRLLAHFPRQRFDAEMIRDSILAISGRLDPAMGGSLVNWKNNEYAPGDEISAKAVRRTIYLPIVRDRVFDALTIFDFANPSVCTAQRTPTVVSHQALFFLNSPLIKESAAALAKSLLARSSYDDAAGIREAYNRILNRPATDGELNRALRFLTSIPEDASAPDNAKDRRQKDFAAFCQTLFASNEFVYRF
jgi:hypothetical protein